MLLRRPARLIAAWIAMLAILLAALAPAVSHALGSKPAASWVEVCTAEGSRWLPLSDDGPSERGHSLEHCPYCSLQTDMPALPPAPDAALPLPLDGTAVPAAFLSAPRTLHAWSTAQPRAPPLFS